MKTLKSMLFGLAILLVSGVANAKVQPNASTTLSKNDVVTVYTNAVIHGNLQNLDQALAKDVDYTILRGEKTFKLNKQALLESFKASENVEQACQYNTSILSDVDNTMVLKFDMQYEGFMRTSTLTIKKQGEDWKITKIETRNS